MSSIIVADRKKNGDGSEIEITSGIRRKVDLEHSVECVLMDHESDKDIEFPPEVHWKCSKCKLIYDVTMYDYLSSIIQQYRALVQELVVSFEGSLAPGSYYSRSYTKRKAS